VVLGQIVDVGAPEYRKDSEEDGEGDDGEGSKDAPLKSGRPPEDGGVAERAVPEQIDPIREGGAAAEEDHGEDGKDDENAAAAWARGLNRARPIDGFGQFDTPLYGWGHLLTASPTPL
jgi:hypothetical protein